MITLGVEEIVAVSAIIFLLICAAGFALYFGLRAREESARLVAANQEGEALRAGTPALAMVVRGDGRIDMPPRMADWLGLASVPRFFDDLAAGGQGAAGEQGMEPEDAVGLADDVGAAQRSGRSFVRAVRPVGSDRAITLRGARAAGSLGATGAVVIWALDATESQAEIRRLSEDVDQLSEAYSALTGLIEAAPLPMWYRSADLNLAMVNSAYVQAVDGADAADVITRGIELVEGPPVGAAAARAAARPTTQVLPATIGGERRTFQIHDVPLPTGGIAGFAVDIEELEQSLARAKRFNDAQRAMLDQLSAGVAQFAADRGMVFCNQPFRRMFAMRSEWLADRPEFDRILERMREADRLPEVRDFPNWKKERRDWFFLTEGAIEENWHLRGGVHLRVVAQPLPDGGLLLVFEDRTEQVQLASARDTLLRVRTATFDNLFEALAVFAADGRLQLWNNRMRGVWGFEEEFLTAHPRVDAFAAAAAAKLATPSRSALIPELVRSATIDRQQRGGRVMFADGRHFEFAAVPLPDGNALFTMLDISDARRAEQALRDRANALEEADRVKTNFVANMSYELRTPLTSISGFAEMLSAGYAGKLSKEADAYVEAILESVERLGLLVDDVLDLTRGNADVQMERIDVDLTTVVRAAAERTAGAAKRRKVKLKVNLGRSAGRITGDELRLRDVIEHVLRHAIGSASEGGTVLLEADGSAAAARIIVSNDGPTMNEASVASAFDRFAEPGAQPTGERALGLGLPLAKQFVEAHGGTIRLTSEEGKATVVAVELPRR